MPLDRRAQRLLSMLAAGGSEPQTPAARRASLRGLAEMADDRTAPALIEHRAAPGPAGPIPLRLYTPPGDAKAARPGLVFFHGGGWVAGDLDTHDGLCRRLARAAGCRIIAVDYRLAPEHPFPAALDDCLSAMRWVAANAASLGIDPARLAVGGDSVGGGLAAAVARLARDAGPSIALQVLICPILDPACTGGSREDFGQDHFIDRAAFARDLTDYAGPDPRLDDPRLSPLRAADLAGLPPAVIHTAEYDPFRDEGEVYAAALARAGVLVETTRHDGLIHYFYALARAIPHAEAAAASIGAQMRAMLEPAALAAILAHPIPLCRHGRA